MVASVRICSQTPSIRGRPRSVFFPLESFALISVQRACVHLDALMRELESQLSKLVGQANAKWGFDGWSSSLLPPLQVLAAVCLRESWATAAALPFGELLELHDAQNDGRLNVKASQTAQQSMTTSKLLHLYKAVNSALWCVTQSRCGTLPQSVVNTVRDHAFIPRRSVTDLSSTARSLFTEPHSTTLYSTLSRYIVRTLLLTSTASVCARVLVQPLVLVALHFAELISAEPFVAGEALRVSDRVISALADQVCVFTAAPRRRHSLAMRLLPFCAATCSSVCCARVRVRVYSVAISSSSGMRLSWFSEMRFNACEAY
eukprot:12473-Heterococcus_DN1.PRE.8